MGGRLILLAHGGLLSILIAFDPCQPEKKPPSIFGEQRPIIRYGEIKENEFTVQVGADSRSLLEASLISSRLRAAGIANFIECSPAGDKYRVCVGKFVSRVRAERMLKLLRRKNISGTKVAGRFEK